MNLFWLYNMKYVFDKIKREMNSNKTVIYVWYMHVCMKDAKLILSLNYVSDKEEAF